MLFCFFFLDKGLRLPSQTVARAMSSSGGATPPYTTLAISRPTESITHVELHRPEKRNAMNSAFWRQESELHIYIFYSVRGMTNAAIYYTWMLEPVSEFTFS